MVELVKTDNRSESAPELIVGGASTGFPLDQWPHFNGVPLSYLARYIVGEDTYFVFLDGPKNEVEQSWQPEGGSNAVVRVSDGIVSHLEWIALMEVDEPLERLTAVYNVDVGGDPEWLQGDEYQEGYPFVGQIDSDLDQSLNIGDATGVAYLFVNNDTKEGRLIWQA